MKNVPSFVWTGGPCGGKTIITAYCVDHLISHGFYPFVCPEAATLFLNGNVKTDNFYFQKAVFGTQMYLYDTFNHAALQVKNPVVLHDRGVLDNLAYMSKPDFRAMIEPHTIEHLRDSQFKAVIHLQTAAIDAEEFYTLENNAARTETPERARELDGLLLEAWNGHPKHIVIVNKKRTFEEKKEAALGALLNALGVPVPIEDEQRYLLTKYFDANRIPFPVVSTPIVQDYLITNDDTEERVRQRGSHDPCVYFHTTKQSIEGSTARIKKEQIISRSEYLRLLKRKDRTRATIRKNRITFSHEGLYFELDVFSHPIQRYILEVKKTIPGMVVIIPSFLKDFIEKEITGESRYSNASIAKSSVLV